jgi:tetratricopeptide (TPR) repeat protein
MSMWLLAGALSIAWADPGAYQSCCTAVEAGGCPTSLAVFGPGTERTGATLQGVWQLDCQGGAHFEPDIEGAAAPGLGLGDVLTPLTETAAQCFDAACELPPDLCVRPDAVRARVVRCSDGGDPDTLAWSQPPASSEYRAVVMGTRVMKAVTGAPRALTERFRAAYNAAVDVVAPTPRPEPAVVQVGPTMEPEDLTVPEAPSLPCVPNQALREASLAQTDLASEALVAGDVPLALGKFRAALAMDECNAYAWAALGEALYNHESLQGARTAFSAATELMPKHFYAWTRLGQAAEQSGDLPAASVAYRNALNARPEHGPAVDGLERVSAAP